MQDMGITCRNYIAEVQLQRSLRVPGEWLGQVVPQEMKASTPSHDRIWVPPDAASTMNLPAHCSAAPPLLIQASLMPLLIYQG